MSSDRSGNPNIRPPLKPIVATASKSARLPLTPRVAGTTTSTRPTVSATARPVLRAPPSRATPAIKQDERSANATLSTANVTPRSAARNSRGDIGSHNTGTANDPTQARPKSTNATGYASPTASALDPGRSLTGMGIRPKSMNESTSKSAVALSTGVTEIADSSDSRFFHASDAHKQEPAPKRPEPKKSPAFFYADGQQEQKKLVPPMVASPALSVLSENQFAAPWTRTEGTHPKSPSVMSPAMSTLSNGSPYFSPAPSGLYRSPSPSKENIHLSYRKGVSQIFGTRPFVKSPTAEAHGTITEESASPRTSPPHRKSASVSSLDTHSSFMSRRRSGTAADGLSSPLAQAVESSSPCSNDRLKLDLSSINTTLSPSEAAGASNEATMSPTRGVSEFAAEARRERKVLDLEISNSSLLAINTSLEREVRRQKAELKRFRRLSRAGRFSFGASERNSRVSEGLSTLDEEATEDLGDDAGSANLEFSSDEDSDSLDYTDDASSDTRSTRGHDRLAKDEKRLQVDLAKHRELLTQSQMMNQTIKRCMYATEEMIADGKKALDYHVRVSDVKLGGRILSGHDEEDSTEIEIVDDEVDTTNTTSNDDEVESARGLLQVWQGVGQHKVDGSEGGDRDSGIEVDKSYFLADTGLRAVNPTSDSGRPPGEDIL